MVATAAFLGIFGMFLGWIMMLNASPPDTQTPGFVVLCCGAVLIAAAFVQAVAGAVH